MQVFNTQFLHKDEQKIYAPLQHLRTVIWMLFCSGGLRPSGSAKHLKLATPLGFEPRITPPKGAVLPLHHGVCGLAILDRRFSIQEQSPKYSERFTVMRGNWLPRATRWQNRGGIIVRRADCDRCRAVPYRLWSAQLF